MKYKEQQWFGWSGNNHMMDTSFIAGNRWNYMLALFTLQQMDVLFYSDKWMDISIPQFLCVCVLVPTLQYFKRNLFPRTNHSCRPHPHPTACQLQTCLLTTRLHFSLHTAGISFHLPIATVGRPCLSLSWARSEGYELTRARESEACSAGIIVKHITVEPNATLIHAGWLPHCCQLIWLARRKQLDYIIHVTAPFVVLFSWEKKLNRWQWVPVITAFSRHPSHALLWAD